MLSLKLVRGTENADGVRHVVQVPTEQARFVIGRDPLCDWPIADKQLALSARHCEIVRIEGRQVLRDTSTNGTFVNGARERLPADHLLRHGDRIQLGNYLIEVSVELDVAAPQARAAAVTAPTAPRRGGDPAAMVGSNWESARQQAPGGFGSSGGSGADVKTGLTRISKPPSKEAMKEAMAEAMASSRSDAAAGAEALAVREPAPVRRAPPGTPDVLQRLAGGLGVPVEALGSSDPAVAAERVARLLRVAVLSLHRQMAAQARQLRELGSRAPLALTRSEAARLRMAPGPEEAMSALLGSGDEAEAMLVRAQSELGQHMQRLLAASQAAGTRLGEQLAPAAIERSAGANGTDDAARLWKIYGSVWTALGIGGVGKSWAQCYGEAAAAYLAAAYDDPQLALGDKAAAPAAASSTGESKTESKAENRAENKAA